MTERKPTYGRLESQGDRWVLSDVPPHVAIRLKNMFARIPKTQTEVFTLPLSSESSADLCWFFHRYPFRMSDADRALLEGGRLAFEDDRAEMEGILVPDWVPPSRHGFRPDRDAYHYQKQASEIWLRRKSLLLGDGLGLGKTVSALHGLAGSQYLPAAVIVQAHLPDQWVEEFIKPFTYMTAHIIKGTKPYRLPPANLYIFKYTNIHGWVDVAATGMFKAVVFDEIQDLRQGEATQKGKAAKVFSENAALRLGLSGTPIFNYGGEVWSVLSYIDPDVLGPFEEFVREWCSWGGNGKYKVKNPDALGSYLREAGVYLRRTRQGRRVNRLPIEVDFDEEVAADSQRLARQLAMKVTTGSFVERGQAARELDMFARLQTGLAKARSVAVLARMYLKAGTPLLIGAWHREVYRILLEELAEFSPVMFTGSETAAQKNRAKQALLSGKSDVLLISLRSGAGVDGFQKRCSTLIIAEQDWSPGVESQLIGRIDRPGQVKDEIDVIYPWVNFGSDPVLMAVKAIKSDQLRGINDPGAEPAAVYTDESRIKMLAEAFLEGSA